MVRDTLEGSVLDIVSIFAGEGNISWVFSIYGENRKVHRCPVFSIEGALYV